MEETDGGKLSLPALANQCVGRSSSPDDRKQEKKNKKQQQLQQDKHEQQHHQQQQQQQQHHQQKQKQEQQEEQQQQQQKQQHQQKQHQKQQEEQQQQQQQQKQQEQQQEQQEHQQQQKTENSTKMTDYRFTYNMSHKRRGTCVIINNMEFDRATKQSKRPGSEVDARNMNNLFEWLGFDVILNENQTADQMFECALSVASKNHTDADCFSMVILSHGKDFGEVWGVDGVVLLDRIYETFKNSKTLTEKPKLFFIQACRGRELDDGVDLSAAHRSNTKSTTMSVRKQAIPLQPDFLCAYSSPPGHFSFRNPKDGTWFIQSINKMFRKHAHDMDIIKMMTRVNKMMSNEFESHIADEKIESDPKMKMYDNKKQVSYVMSMLTKTLYLVPKPASSDSSSTPTSDGKHPNSPDELSSNSASANYF